ncbi:MAG: hypothetical protein J5746_12185 [Victivallales bacterium]|nr:hypothetical protein [Victivallales bacterium]
MPINTDSNIDPLRRRAIDRLLKKRQALNQAADELATMPASYGITGSVSVTNQKIADLKAEVSEIDLQIKRLLVGSPPGFSLSYPDYRWRFDL